MPPEGGYAETCLIARRDSVVWEVEVGSRHWVSDTQQKTEATPATNRLYARNAPSRSQGIEYAFEYFLRRTADAIGLTPF